jgi:hypothetical protein
LWAALGLISLGWVFYLAGQFGLLPDRVGSGFVGGFSDATLYGSAILTIAFLRHRSRAALILLCVLVPMTSGFNFFTGYKTLVLTPPAMVALAWIVYQRRIHMRWMILGLAALLLLYPAAQFYREVILVRNTRTLSDVARNPGPAFDALSDFMSSNRGAVYLADGLHATGRRLDGVGHAAVIMRDTPDVVPFQNGWTLGLIPLTYVPRVIWPEKPTITISAWIVDMYRFRGERIESSIGPTWAGEFYLNFGVWGVIGGMLFLGILIRFAHEALTYRVPTSFVMLIEIMVIYEIMLKLTGSIATVVNGPIMAAIPIVGAHMIIRGLGGARRHDNEEREAEVLDMSNV